MKSWVDRMTGRVTMYRLVVIVLVAIAANSLVLSLVGALFFSPLQLLASATVALAATYASNRLFALVFSVSPHSESSIITALLLFFLFFPSIDPRDLGGIALAAALASASKYVLAIRRRHIFNPAAIGAVAVTLLQVTATSWWVATPALLPVTALGAALVLYRTRHLTLGVVFIVVSLALVTARLALGGADVASALGTAVASYPIVFLAGFMLSEPLTLPPRRWQQLAEAVVVALLFSIPYSLGPVHSTPELALVVGNLLAFFAGQRRGIRLNYLGSRQLGSGILEFAFEPERPVAFAAGQYMELTIPHGRADIRGIRRVFSLASAPGDASRVAFGIRMPERSSSFKRAFAELAPGTRVTATAVGGDFVLPSDASKPVLLVAGGIGITPFVSQLTHDRDLGVERDIVLVYSVSDAEDVPYRVLLDGLGVRVLLAAPTAPADLPANWSYLGAGPLSESVLRSAISGLASRRAFVSGPPRLVDDARVVLRRCGVRRVHTDYFSGY